MFVKRNILLHTKRGSGGEAPGKIFGVNKTPPLIKGKFFEVRGGGFIKRAGVFQKHN